MLKRRQVIGAALALSLAACGAAAEEGVRGPALVFLYTSG
jgi:hypothetical protein